ncbi:MAG: DUF222 domain-containing protein, partial [Actinomycetaceae bacterium]
MPERVPELERVPERVPVPVPEPEPEVRSSVPFLDPLGRAEAVLGAADELVGADLEGLSGERASDVLDVLESAERRLAAVRAAVVVRIESDGLWALDGPRTMKTWLRDRTRTTSASAGRQLRTSRALRDHLPVTKEALTAGLIGAEQVAILAREATRTTVLQEQLRDTELGETFLVDQAQQMGAGQFAQLVKAWAIAADPDAADRAWRDDDAKEELTVAATTGGYHVNGWLDDLSGYVVTTALNAHMGIKDADDRRTPAQRRAAAFVSLAHQSLDVGQQMPHARIRPHVTVTATLETLRALAAATGSVIPPQASSADGDMDATAAAADPTAGRGSAARGSSFGLHPDWQARTGAATGTEGNSDSVPGGRPRVGPATDALFEL